MWPFRKPAKPDYSLLKGIRAYRPYRPEPEQNPPQSVSGAIPWEKHPGPDPVMQAYEREMEDIRWRLSLRFVDWEEINARIAHAESLRKAAMQSPDVDRTQYPIDDPAAMEALKLVSVISPDEACARWGFTAQQSADALIGVFGVQEPEPVGESGGGIAPCGYEEL